MNEQNQTISFDIITLAIEKINREFQEFKGDSKEKVVSSYVSNIIQDFCKQDKRFAEVVYQFKRTLSDCCEYAMKGVGSAISDIDVYRNAVSFYFPNAEISMNMSIDISGEAPPDDVIYQEPAPKPEKKKSRANKKSQTKAKEIVEADDGDDYETVDDSYNTECTEKRQEAKKPVITKTQNRSKKKKDDDSSVIQLSLW